MFIFPDREDDVTTKVLLLSMIVVSKDGTARGSPWPCSQTSLSTIVNNCEERGGKGHYS
jgi:hypothetical protein